MNKSTENSRQTGPSDLEPEVSTRRKLLRAGLSVPPAILTLTSRPVLAWDCKTPSAHSSLSYASHHPGKGLANENTKTLAVWQQSGTAFPSPYTRANTPCNTGGSPAGMFPPNRHSGKKAAWVLANGTNLDKYLVAAFLNCRLVPNAALCLNYSELSDMWMKGPSGTFQPTPGVNWGEIQIIAYLKNNWIVPA